MPGVIRAIAPIRICDIGGWTDTWFAGHGKVLNIGVSPYVEVRVKVHPLEAMPHRLLIEAENFGERYGFDLDALPNRHPLLEAAVVQAGLPGDASLEVSISSGVPPGCSTGTSAAVIVAVIGALDALTPGRMSRHDIASAAHQVELALGLESGVQDQLCAAYGRINYIDIPSYPTSKVVQPRLDKPTWQQLDERLMLVLLSRAHTSSEVHERVIAHLGDQRGESPILDDLRHAAESAYEAIQRSDFDALGRAMSRNTEAQRQLDASLVCEEAETVIDLAAAHGARGWKINGAGGQGGSLTLLCGPEAGDRTGLERALNESFPSIRVVPTKISRHGLRVWSS